MEEVVEVEYLSAWPPAENTSEANSLSATIASGSPPAQKRFKYELTRCDRRLDSSCSGSDFFGELSAVELQKQLSPEELHIVHCDYSVSADALLARWWKIMMSKRSADYVAGTGLLAEEEEEIFAFFHFLNRFRLTSMRVCTQLMTITVKYFINN